MNAIMGSEKSESGRDLVDENRRVVVRRAQELVRSYIPEGRSLSEELIQERKTGLRSHDAYLHAYEILSKATVHVDLTGVIEERAQELNRAGLQPLDALHLAAAVEVEADYFCTCDDKLLRRAKALDSPKTKVVSPLELILELGL